jgi:hypothetical protein
MLLLLLRHHKINKHIQPKMYALSNKTLDKSTGSTWREAQNSLFNLHTEIHLINEVCGFNVVICQCFLKGVLKIYDLSCMK